MTKAYDGFRDLPNRRDSFLHHFSCISLGGLVNRPPIWFERTFEFTFLVEQHPNLCARLRGTPARLEELVRGSFRDLLVRKPEDKWSAQEHAGHLLDLESLWRARVADYLAGRSELTAADLKNRKTHEANHNARPVDQILKEFREARSEEHTSEL